MGKLIFSQKTIAGVSGLKPNTYYRVKSLLGSTYLYEIFNASDLYAAGSDTISIWQNGDINSTPITALNNDPEWIDPVSEQNIDNTLIPVGAVIVINSFLNHSYSGAILVAYNQGKTSIKKQNLTKLKSGNFFNQQESTYIFRSATNNTLGQIFDASQFEVYSDTLTIYDSNLNPIDSFFSDGVNWLYSDFTTIADGYVFSIDTALVFGTSFNFDINVNGGAIIQKYYSGKLSLKSSAIPLNILNIRVNNGPTNSPWGVGGSGPCGNDFQLSNNQNGIWSQSNLGCDFFIAWDNQYGNLPYKWRMYYDSDGRTDYAFHPTAGPEALPSKGWSNGMTITAI